MAPYSSTLAWKIPWMEEPGRLQSMGSLKVRHFTFTFYFHALEKEMATHSSVLALRIPATGAWWAAVYGVAQSPTQLKRLSSSSSKRMIKTLGGNLKCEEVRKVSILFYSYTTKKNVLKSLHAHGLGPNISLHHLNVET